MAVTGDTILHKVREVAEGFAAERRAAVPVDQGGMWEAVLCARSIGSRSAPDG